MPSERFHNIRPIKKRAFLNMAYKEFALHSYEGASITRLVRDLKMAKGSIYQYFEDKEDLYNYLVENAQSKLIEVVDKTCPPPTPDQDFKKWLEKFILIQTKFFLAIPSYAALFSKRQAHFRGNEVLNFAGKKIEDASKSIDLRISREFLYSTQNLPLLIFNYITLSENIDLNEIINSDSSIAIPTDKLLYLCEAFLQKL